MTLYTDEIKRVVRETKKPVKFVLDIIEHFSRIELRVYENDIMNFEADARNAIMIYLLQLRSEIEKHGVACWINGVVGDPPRVR